MDLYQIIITIVGYLFGAGGLVFWFLERRKFNAEVKATLESVRGAEIDNDVKLSNHYKEILDDLKKRYEDRYLEFESIMERKVKLLEDENKILGQKNRVQKQEIYALKREIKEKDKQIDELLMKR